MRKPARRRGINPVLKYARMNRESRPPEIVPRRQVTACSLAVEQLEARCLPSTLQPISLPPANQPPSDTASGASNTPSVSADGRYIAFQSSAPNLVTGQTGEVNQNVFLLDRSTGSIVLVSHIPGNPTTTPSNGPYVTDSRFPIISLNGRYAVYLSDATQIVGLGPSPADQVVSPPAAAPLVRAARRTHRSQPTPVVRRDGPGPGHNTSSDGAGRGCQAQAAVPAARSPPPAGLLAPRAQASRVVRGRTHLSGLRPDARRYRDGSERTTRLPAGVVVRGRALRSQICLPVL
jgi:hypothetical protein